ncbi:acetyl-CoA hydrolase/transferase [Leptospira santarosai]|uniref:Acetyl-CoA hydrolase/transferase n=1 Tax=Leptospira santarosai TaxID=28183 RepID=A0AB73LXP7_9LEPT|nr:acetyl-CoA hydrolase/transferase [Leptospira santarosai]
MKDKFISANSALFSVQSSQRVFVHSVAAAPALLIDALTARADELSDVEIIHLHTEGKAPYAESGMEGKFFTNALFVAANTRKAVEDGRGDYIPIFLSECPSLFRKGILPLDVALLQVSPPDHREKLEKEALARFQIF